MALAKKTWLQKYGLKLVGNGPAFIASIEKNSIAGEFGLQIGDRIIEFDGYDVDGLSADVIMVLMKSKKSFPTSLGIVSELCEFVLHCGRLKDCGFSISSDKFVTVIEVTRNGMAFLAGLRKGDIIVAANNKPLTKIKGNTWELITENDHVTLSVIPTGERGWKITLFIHQFSFRPFIPTEQHEIFEPLMKKKYLYCNCSHQMYSPSKKHIILNLRITCANNPLGFVIKGSGPVHVEWLDPGGPAETAGILPGDFIMEINDIDTRNMTHEQVVKILKKCGPAPLLQIERHPKMAGKFQVNSLFETTNFIANTNEESFDWIVEDFSSYKDSEGFTFKQKMEYLLTSQERKLLLLYFFQYINSSNIIRLLTYLRLILDTPSKKSLWLFLILKMSTKDRKYIRVKENLNEYLNNNNRSLMEHHLSTCENNKVKNNLGVYAVNKTFGSIINIEHILNTPAKQTVWLSILPDLIHTHQALIKGKILSSNKHLGAAFSSISAVNYNEENTVIKQFPLNIDSTANDMSDSSICDNSISASSSSLSYEETQVVLAASHQHSKSKSCTECEKMFWSYADNQSESQPAVHDKLLTSFLKKSSNSNRKLPPVTQNGVAHNSNSVSEPPTLPKHKSKANYKLPSSVKGNQTRTLPDFYNTNSTNKVPLKTTDVTQSERESKHLQQSEKPENNSNPLPSTSKDVKNKQKNLVPKEKSQSTNSLVTSGTQGSLKADLTDLAAEEDGHAVIIPTHESLKVKTLQEHDTPSCEEPIVSKKQNPTTNTGRYSKNEKMDSKSHESNKFLLRHVKQEPFSKSQELIPDKIRNSRRSNIENKLRSKSYDRIPSKDSSNKFSNQVKASNNSSTGENEEHKSADKLTATEVLHQMAELSNSQSDLPVHSWREDEKYHSQKWLKSHISVSDKIKQLESNTQTDKKEIVPPVPPPLPNFVMSTSQSKLKNKRLHWQKIEGEPNENTIWYKVNKSDPDDIIPLLNLEKRFAFKTSEPEKSKVVKKKIVSILDSRKSYNISILLGHLKLPSSSIKAAILSVDDKLLTYEFLRQLLVYCPSKSEQEEFKNYNGKIGDLNQADQVTCELIKIPSYEDRLKVLLFRADFKERITKLNSIIHNIMTASVELRKSNLLVNVLQIDDTKDIENKTSLLHSLTDAINKKFPNSDLRSELLAVVECANVSNADIFSELKEIQTSWQKTTELMKNIEQNDSKDPIQDIMNIFLSKSNSTLEDLFEDLEEAVKEFHTTLEFFGENDVGNITTDQIFGIFAEFLNKYEVVFSIEHSGNAKEKLK
ncbi:delphilin-like isoform X1 [Octopus vulgaris]|uniref:Delphilin-like isoform X1 n=1 Tax=Octopus vulgaris TaxID=6645 RepID=A0AA36EXV2_OCTVU|nr:delphilin-like isoform X1 [Octopus vulgaris]